MKSTNKLKKIMTAALLTVTLMGCQENDESASSAFFSDITHLRENGGIEISCVAKEGGFSASSVGYVLDTDTQIDSILQNYVTANSVEVIDESVKDAIRYGIHARNNWIDHLLHFINDGSTKVEDESVFDNATDNPMITTDRVVFYIDGQDHLKVVSQSDDASSLQGVYTCEGISDLIDQFLSDQSIHSELIYELIRNCSDPNE